MERQGERVRQDTHESSFPLFNKYFIFNAQLLETKNKETHIGNGEDLNTGF